MEKRVPTIIIEPRLVLREALELLMGNHSYRVVCGVGSIEEIGESSFISDGPELVILGAQSAVNAARGAEGIRSLWPNSKIIFLFDDVPPPDFTHLLVSQIDGCIPLFVSPDTLINTLDLIVSRNVRIMVMGDTGRALKSSQTEEVALEPGNKSAKSQSNGGGRGGMAGAPFSVPALALPMNTTGSSEGHSFGGHAHLMPGAPRLSEREAQILDGLVKGQANKVIARNCDITEATVKVHMKSILRKIRVGNRTQAAIWALEHGYASDEPKADALQVNGAQNIVM